MNNYSAFIKGKNEITGAGFVEDYAIQDGEVLVYTSGSNKSEPHTDEATPASVKHYEDRLETQFNLLIENQDKVVKYKKGEVRKYIYAAAILLISFSSISLFGERELTELLELVSRLGFILGAGTIATGEISLAVYKDLFKAKMATYKEYLTKRNRIETLAKVDKNITMHLNQKTLDIIRENESLQQTGLIEDVYNISLMNKMELKELRKLLLRYRTSEALREEQVFCMPNQSYTSQEKAKTKTRKPQ